MEKCFYKRFNYKWKYSNYRCFESPWYFSDNGKYAV